jgi:hypothetical protein
MGNTHETVFNWAEKYVIYHLDLIRKPDVLEKKAGRMIINDDVIKLKDNYFDKIPTEKWKITPYQDWDRFIKQIKFKKMQKGALEDKFAFQELEKLVQEFNIERIIETGTYYGWSTKKISELGLKIDTIEINERFYQEVKDILTEENIKLHLGNSVNVLKEIIEESEKNLLIFIDSHWGELPLIQELEVIKNKKIEPVILIHDFYVPDENGNAKFGYDTYRGIILNYEFIEKSLNEIYPNGFDYYYTKEIEFCNSGTIYITPKKI